MVQGLRAGLLINSYLFTILKPKYLCINADFLQVRKINLLFFCSACISVLSIRAVKKQLLSRLEKRNGRIDVRSGERHNHTHQLLFFKIFSNFVHFCPNFQIFIPFCSFKNIFNPFSELLHACPYFRKGLITSLQTHNLNLR